MDIQNIRIIGTKVWSSNTFDTGAITLTGLASDATKLKNVEISGNRIKPSNQSNETGIDLNAATSIQIGPNNMAGTGKGTYTGQDIRLLNGATISSLQNMPDLKTKSSNYSAGILDDRLLHDATSGNITATLPSAVGMTTKIIYFKKTDSSANTVIVTASGGQTIDGSNTKTLVSQNATLAVISDGANWKIVTIIDQATSSQSGYLTSADWTAFNAKQGPIGYTPVNKAGDTINGALTVQNIISAQATGTNNVSHQDNDAHSWESNGGGWWRFRNGWQNNGQGFQWLGSAGSSAATLEVMRLTGAGFLTIALGVNSANSPLQVGGPIATALSSKTAAYTITVTDSVILGDATTAAFTVTLPTAVGIVGRQYTIKLTSTGANAVTVGTTSSQSVDGTATKTFGSQNASITVVSDGTNWQIVGQMGMVT